MKLRDKIKSYSFWVSLASAIILILKNLGNRFGFSVDETMISDLFTALCSILVLLGIIVVPTNPQATKSTNDIALNTKHSLSQKNILPQENNNQNESTEILKEDKNSSKLEEILENNLKIEIAENLSETIIHPETESEFNSQNSQDFTEDLSVNMNDMPQNFEEINKSVTESQIETNISISKPSSIQSLESTDVVEPDSNSNIYDLKKLLNQAREKFSGNIDTYIFELQEEIRKTREGV